jgi:hypothetical protein
MLLFVQIYVSMLDIFSGPSISFEPFFIVAIVASTFFLDQYQIYLFAIFSAALSSFSFFASLGYQTALPTLLSNFLLTTFTYCFVGVFSQRAFDSRE